MTQLYNELDTTLALMASTIYSGMLQAEMIGGPQRDPHSHKLAIVTDESRAKEAVKAAEVIWQSVLTRGKL